LSETGACFTSAGNSHHGARRAVRPVIGPVVRTVAVIVRWRWRDVAGRGIPWPCGHRIAGHSVRRRSTRPARRGERGRDDIAVLALKADLTPAALATADIDRCARRNECDDGIGRSGALPQVDIATDDGRWRRACSRRGWCARFERWCYGSWRWRGVCRVLRESGLRPNGTAQDRRESRDFPDAHR
jgi:hypothetical protein